MRKNHVCVAWGLGLSLLAHSAAANERSVVWHLTVEQSAGTTLSCSVKSWYGNAADSSSMLRVSGTEATPSLPKDWQLSLDAGGAPIPLAPTEVGSGALLFRKPTSDLAGKTLLLKQGNRLQCAQPLVLPIPEKVAQPSGKETTTGTSGVLSDGAKKGDPPQGGADNGIAATEKERYFGRLDQLALRYLRETLRIQENHVSGGELGKTYDVYHLPSGRLAFPLAAHISEKDRLRLHVAVPEDAVAKIDVSACDDVPGIRILGSVDGAVKDLRADSTFRKITGSQPAEPRFVLLDHSQTLHCAGTLRYRVQVSTEAGDSQSPLTAITIEPVYLVSVGLSFVFDFGKPTKISLQDVDSVGNDAQKVIHSDREFSGFRPLVSIGLHPCRANPRDWSACDWIVPFIAIDPTRVTQGFAAGVGISPFSGIAIQGGMSLFQSEVLDSSVSVSVGDRWTKPGEPAKRAVFNSDSVGGFIGVSLSSDLYHRLWSR